jgi:hypothetical protein
MEKGEPLIEIYTGPFERASVLRGLLEAYGIDTILRDSALGVENPSYSEPIGTSRIFKVFVGEGDYELAQAIIEAPPEQNAEFDR